MSTQGLNPGFTGQAVRSRQYIKKNAGRIYKQSFGDLPEGTIYRDPAGFKTGGEPVTLQKDRFEQYRDEPVFDDGSSIIEKWNDLQRKGFSVQETVREIRKNLDTGDWTLPIDIIPEVFVVNPEQLPLADMMPRVTTQDDEVVPTPLTDHPDISWGLETTDDTEGSYDYADPTYDDTLSFDVEGFGAATRLEDKLILASSNLRNAESTQEQAFVRAMQQELERQIILGTTNGDASGFTGLDDLISNDEGDTVTDLDPDTASAEDYENATRDIIDSAEYAGAARDSLAVVCDFDWHREVRDSLVSNQRYDEGVEVAAGFTTLTLDDVPVMKSHAIERIGDRADGSTYNQAYTVNFDAHYLAMLQETSVKPLAKVAPQEQFAVDAYGTLVAEDDGAHVQAATVSPTA